MSAATMIDASTVPSNSASYQQLAARFEAARTELHGLAHAIRVNIPRLDRLAGLLDDTKLAAVAADIEADLRAALAALEES